MKSYFFLITFFILCFIFTKIQGQEILYASPDKLQPNAFYNVQFFCSETHFTTIKPTLKLIKTGFEYIPQFGINVLNDTVLKIMINTDGTKIQSGIYDIVIKDSIDGPMIKAQGIEIIAAPGKPQIISIKPDSCNRGDTITLRVLGKNTFFNENNVEILSIQSKSDIVSTPYKTTYYNDTLMDVSFHLLSKYYGYCDFIYFGKKENLIKISNALYVRPPDNPIYISHLSEDTVVRGNTCRFYIFGKNTNFTLLTSNSSIYLYGGASTKAINYTVINDTVIDAEFKIPFTANGILTLGFYLPTFGQMYLNNCLQVVNNPDMLPVILSVSPDSTKRNRWVTIFINCKNTLFTLDRPRVFLTKVSFTSIQADTVYNINDTTLRAVFWIDKNTEPGKWNLMISNAFDGLFTADSIINIKSKVGIWDRRTLKKFSISPNPMDNYTVISFNNPDNQVFNLQITDIYGRIIYQNPTIKSSQFKLLRNEMKPGFYIVSLSNELSLGKMKLIVR
jgi:hypothetical protein